MKIFALTPKNSVTGLLTPEERYLKKLEDYGHKVVIADQAFDLPESDFDVIVAMSEVSCENAYKLSQKYQLPFYAHMEWIPDWRVFKDSEFNWGYLEPIPYHIKMNYVRMYQHYVYFWSLADVKTLAAKCFGKTMTEFTGIHDLKIYTKYLGPDTDEIKKQAALFKDVQKEEAITCIARFVPHKRLHHVLKAMKLINYTGTIYLVGYGGEKTLYEMMGQGLNLKFVESKDKYETIAKSKLVIALWSGIVPAEAMYFGVPVITYESKYMTELYGKSIIYTKNNSISDLAEKTATVLNMSPEERAQLAEEGIFLLESGMINTCTMEGSARLLEKLIHITVKGDII